MLAQFGLSHLAYALAAPEDLASSALSLALSQGEGCCISAPSLLSTDRMLPSAIRDVHIIQFKEGAHFNH